MSANTAEAERDKVATDSEVSLGKFKDVNALLGAYNSLQSEFTKRCQRIKELEGKIISDKTRVPENNDTGRTVDAVLTADAKKGENAETAEALKIAEATKTVTANPSADKDKILREYLISVLGAKQKAIVMDDCGAGLITPREKPKSIAEAGNLAKEIF